MENEKRFIPCDNPPNISEWSEGTKWFYDTHRPLDDKEQPFILVQVEEGKDPNNIVIYDEMFLLFTDQCEYYAVCGNCRALYNSMQWSGSTEGGSNWRERAKEYLENHISLKGWCEFCDPVLGNGGWRLDPY